jgi:hypothetical protein
MARLPAMEGCTVVDILYLRQLGSVGERRRTMTLAVRIVPMISKLE